MAPTKSTRAVSKQSVATTTLTNLMPLARKGLTRRNATNVQDQNSDIMQTRGKRKAEHSPQKNEKIKRSALGNLTNNVNNNNQLTNIHQDDDAKHNIVKKKDLVQNLLAAGGQQENTLQILKETQNLLLQQAQGALQKQQQPVKILTRASSRNATKDAQKENLQQQQSNITSKIFEDEEKKLLTSVKTKLKNDVPAAPVASLQPHQVQKTANKPVRRISNEFNKTEESLYMSALEDISVSDSMRLSGNFEAAKRRSILLQQQQQEQNKTESITVAKETSVHQVPEGVEDFDKLNWNDPFQVSHYAMDIFNYLKEREAQFPVDDYMERQIHLSKWMRSLLVDWMVEVQETFELNHETLYLAVKIVDQFLCREVINKDKLQLLGAAALFIACKFDERTPPLIEDFLYICDGAYKHDELIQMEMATLKVIQFDLGIPLSYRFLRRYARCAKVPMPTLTLARYILELSLMDYDCITFSDSKMACAALFMALRLHGDAQPWTSTLIYYTGYKLADFADIVPILNAGLHRKPKGTIKTIRSKYSHKIFHEVAKVALMTTEKLFENQLDFNFNLMSSQITANEQQQQTQKSTKTKSQQGSGGSGGVVATNVMAAPTVDILTDTVGGLTGGLLGTLDALLGGGSRRQPEQHIHIYVDQQQQQQPYGMTTYYLHPGQQTVVGPQVPSSLAPLPKFIPTTAPVHTYNIPPQRLKPLPPNVVQHKAEYGPIYDNITINEVKRFTKPDLDDKDKRINSDAVLLTFSGDKLPSHNGFFSVKNAGSLDTQPEFAAAPDKFARAVARLMRCELRTMLRNKAKKEAEEKTPKIIHSYNNLINKPPLRDLFNLSQEDFPEINAKRPKLRPKSKINIKRKKNPVSDSFTENIDENSHQENIQQTPSSAEVLSAAIDLTEAVTNFDIQSPNALDTPSMDLSPKSLINSKSIETNQNNSQPEYAESKNDTTKLNQPITNTLKNIIRTSTISDNVIRTPLYLFESFQKEKMNVLDHDEGPTD
ncbi:G2/mitotic-specific cyclin-B3 [Musca vetustissima]|uniref:G2/mitotic-specific cyclin-B3 n=1 Tax=Musca vetustissima TaxID=27455 RepID=UPI002AB6D1F7|nr:G2/mitotic-specific cyclin-B3 [Musca vetustissima]